MPGEVDLIVEAFSVKVNGTDVPDDVMNNLIQVEIDLSFGMPGRFTLELHDEDLAQVDGTLFALGAEVELAYESGESYARLMKGKISVIEPIYDDSFMTRLRIQGYDGTYLLHQQRKTRVFANATDSDIAQTIAGDNGLTLTADATTTVYDHVYQDNQTDYEFLRERARRAGRWLHADGTTLYFSKASTSRGSTPEIEWGTTLRSFRPRMSTSWQHSEVDVSGWDRKNKAAILGKATTSTAHPSINVGGSGGTVAKAKFGDKTFLAHEYGVETQAEADVIAQSLLDEANSGFVQGEGEAEGNANILPGGKVKLKGLGDKFSGEYAVRRAVHRYTPQEGYSTEFLVSTLSRDTTWDLLSAGGGVPGGGGGASRWSGVVTAIVTNTDDPENQGRVKVKYPWLNDALESWWARLATPLAGPEKGFFLVPEVNDEVLVAFEQGDFNRPCIVGSLWNGSDAPPAIGTASSTGEKPLRLTLVSATGHSISIYDDSENKIEVSTAGGHLLVLDDQNKKVEVVTAGGHTISLDDQMKKIDVKSAGGAELAMDDNARSVKLSSPGTAEVSATGGLTLKGATVNLEGSGPVTIKGAVVNIN